MTDFDDAKFNKACRKIFKQGTEGKVMNDDAIDACNMQSVDPSELMNKLIEEFYDASQIKKGQVTPE